VNGQEVLIYHAPVEYINAVTGPAKISLLINAPYHMVKGVMERLLQLGVGVEVFFENNIIDDVHPREAKELGRMLKERAMSCTVHAPFMDLSPGGFDKKIVAITRDRLKKAVELAHHLGAMGVVCHPGYDKWRFDGDEQLWLDSSIETWTDVLKEADSTIPIMLENIFEEEPATFIMLFDYFKDKNLWFCFDTGHFNLFSRVSVEEWLLPLKERLRHFHLHDNHGKSDEHLPVGTGTFPFRTLKQFIGKVRDPIIFVVEPHTEPSVAESIQRAREFLS
jgi:sugar phosphate isomerase/epimerase